MVDRGRIELPTPGCSARVFAWRGAEFRTRGPKRGPSALTWWGLRRHLGAAARGRPKLQPPGGRHSWSPTTRTGRRQWIGMVDIEPVLGQRWLPKGGAAASSRRATRFFAPRGSRATSARAGGRDQEAHGIAPHLLLPPFRSPVHSMACATSIGTPPREGETRELARLLDTHRRSGRRISRPADTRKGGTQCRSSLNGSGLSR
jgi:hypothetical protein